MKFKWLFPDDTYQLDHEVLAATGQRTLLAHILTRRGITNPTFIQSFLFPDQYAPADPFDLPGMHRGVERLEQAIEQKERILVWGDFDVDGQTSTALLFSALANLGALVEYHVPIREKESHGINPGFLEPYLKNGIHVVLSCDTGIAANEAVELANSYGVDVVVTDHHDCPAILPEARALINPKLFDAPHPLSNLPGVGVAFKLVEALYRRAGRTEEIRSFLDLVALGIVADLAIVTGDTRYLLQRGLDVLRSTGRTGLKEIMENARVEPEHLIDEHIGFQIGPRLNAVGRLADANISIPLLTTKDEERAESIAAELERLNEERKFQTELVYESAEDQIKKNPGLLQYAVLVLAHPTWHQGVIGIVASRMVEKYGKPAILITMPEGEQARGSARSIEGFHITQAIATQEHLLDGYGGHPMAAGLAMDPDAIDEFRKGVSKAIVEQRTGERSEPTLRIDAEVTLKDLTMELVHQLELLAPFGPGNPPVHLLCKKLRVVGQVILGKDKAHKKLVVRDQEDEQREFLWWNSAEEEMPDGFVDCVIRARPGFFRGEEQLTLTLQDIRRSGVRMETEDADHQVTIADKRDASDPRAELEELLLTHTDIQVWAEACRDVPEARHRFELKPGRVLVIWTIPPSQSVINEVLERVQPRHIYVFAEQAEMDRFEAFRRRFGGLIKFTFESYAGKTTLNSLSAAMGHKRKTICYALKLSTNLGVYSAVDDEGNVRLRRGPVTASPDGEKSLRELLKESEAFRSFVRNTEELSRFILIPDIRPLKDTEEQQEAGR